MCNFFFCLIELRCFILNSSQYLKRSNLIITNNDHSADQSSPETLCYFVHIHLNNAGQNKVHFVIGKFILVEIANNVVLIRCSEEKKKHI